MGVIRDLKYKVVKNFLSEDELRLARRYMLQKHNENYESFDFLQNNNCDSYFVNDPLSESLLFIKQKKNGRGDRIRIVSNLFFCKTLYL